MIDDFKRPPQRPAARLDNLQGTPPPPGPQTPSDGYNRPYQQYNPSPAAPRPTYAQPTQPPQQSTYGTDELPPVVPIGGTATSAVSGKASRSPLARLKNLSRKQAIALAAIGIVILSGAGAAAYSLTRPEPAPVVQKQAPAKVAPKPAPKPILSPLTGVAVTAEQQARPVTGVMIENSGNARPQSGLTHAGVVFEAISEYGITRFLAVYQESNPPDIGPIRSVRPYFLDWIMPFDGALAHVGGSPEALQRIKDIGTKDLDQFHNAGAYRRINTRYAPHNMYSSMDALVAAGKARGYEKSSYTGFERKAKEEPSKAPTAKGIDLAVSSAFYNVRYNYNPATNSYKRAMGGSPHVDAANNQQLEPKVVIALAMPYSVKANGYHSEYQTVGTAQAYFFQDGNVTTGTWSKADPKGQFVFKDTAGNPVKLNAGQTWITVVGDPGKVAYTP